MNSWNRMVVYAEFISIVLMCVWIVFTGGPQWLFAAMVLVQYNAISRTFPKTLSQRQQMFRGYARRLERTGWGGRDSARIARWIIRRRLASGYGFSA